jgi:stage V sporulation protein AB
VIIAGGVVGLMIGLAIVPRYAGVTHTGKHILLYEDMTLLGTVLGNLFYFYQWSLPLGNFFLIIYGIFSGVFLGSWVMALSEMADVFPIFSRRIKLTDGLPKIILSIALGKITGSLLYYYFNFQSMIP